VPPAIILFAKAPVPGHVKTRLAALLGAEAAAGIHRAFTADMLEMLAGFAGVADVELHTDIPTDAWPDAPVTRKLQREGNLALRMIHSLSNALAEGRPLAMIVGSDAPTLPRACLETLMASAADVTFGPCEDGGYYAICCRRIHPEMFRGVAWSASTALESSESAARACGLTVARGEQWFDVDDSAGIGRLLRSRCVPRHTAAWLRGAGYCA
jgi:rSAM/selenodomain-associated transferase 1